MAALEAELLTMNPPLRYRKSQMALAGLRQLDIARSLGVSVSLVSKVVHGHRTDGLDATRVREAIAGHCGSPMDKMWPEMPKAA